MHIPQIIAVIGLVAFGSWSSPAQASRPIDRPEHRALIYDLEAFGTKAGKIEVVLSKPRSVAGRTLRAANLKAETAGTAAKMFRAVGEGTSWLDSNWLPVRMNWESEAKGKKRRVDAKMRVGKITGEASRAGEPFKPLDLSFDGRAVDFVGLSVWVASRPLRPGRVYKAPYFDGYRVGKIQATVRGTVEQIHIKSGLRKVLPIDVVVETDKGDRNSSFFIGIDDGVPYRIDVEFSVLGTVRAELRSMQVRR